MARNTRPKRGSLKARLKRLIRRAIPAPNAGAPGAGRRDRVAIVSCITDNFVEHGAAFLTSLAETDSVPAACDVVLLYCPTYAPISAENRAWLSGLCLGARFEQVDTAFLNDDLVRRWHDGANVGVEKDSKIPEKRAVYLKLHMLRMTSYDTVLWLDSDMIILRSIAHLFKMPFDLAMVAGGVSNHNWGVRSGAINTRFNAGLMFVGKPYLSKAWFQRAVALLNEKAHTRVQDQTLLFELWRDEPKFYLPHVYNWKVPRGADLGFHVRAMEDARVVHFISTAKQDLRAESDLPLHRAYFELIAKARA